MKIAWGIDVGVASLGFAVIELDGENRPKRLVDGISVVWPAPVGGAERTRHRSMRKQNKRRQQRIGKIRGRLIDLFDLNPSFDEATKSENLRVDGRGEGVGALPKYDNSRVRLREIGLEDRLETDNLARAILHIARNRGQRLSRGLKDSTGGQTGGERRKNDNEREKTAERANSTASRLEALGRELKLSGAAHPAQLLMRQAVKTGTTRLKKDREDGPVFTRGMMLRELETLLKVQEAHYRSILSNEVRQELSDLVFWEETPKQPAIGKCRYVVCGPDGEIEDRLSRGSDLFQLKRIYEEVNNLRVISRRGTPDRQLCLAERDRLANRLLEGQNITPKRAREELGIGKDSLAEMTTLDAVAHDRGRKTGRTLEGHPLAAAMRKADALDMWRSFDKTRRERIADLVRDEDDQEEIRQQLEEMDLPEAAVAALIEARLPIARSAAGPTATRRLLAELQAAVISNYEAEQRAGLEAMDADPPPMDRLPYYGRILRASCVPSPSSATDPDEREYGRIPNPVVHVALNQLRKTANAYLARYGKPVQIKIELARDMNKSAEEREKEERQNDKNRKINDRYIESLGLSKYRRRDRQLARLHRMQGGECLYTGEPICRRHLDDGSVAIDHILPWADTLDNDGIANLALTFKFANDYKRKRAPWDAFASGYRGQDYATILKRAEKRGRAVHWRFKQDAMDRFRDEDDFRERFLVDTRYIGKMARRYLIAVCDDAAPESAICLNGRITKELRRLWGLSRVVGELMVEDGRLNPADIERPGEDETEKELEARRKRISKIRWDHRHHLLDAIIASCTTRSDVQRLQTVAARAEDPENAADALAEARRADASIRAGGVCWRDGFRNTVKSFLKDRGGDGGGGAVSVSAVVRKPDHNPQGQLHEETLYGVICKVPGDGDSYLVRNHIPIIDLTAKQIGEIEVPETAIRNLQKAVARGESVWWGGKDPVSALSGNLRPQLETMRACLESLMAQAPESELAKARTESGKQNARAKWATAEYIRKTGQKRYTRIQTASLRILRGPLRDGADGRNSKPRKAVRTRRNDRLVYYIDAEAKRRLQIVSTLDANTPGFEDDSRRPGCHLIFTLRANDIVEMESDPKSPDSSRRLYRMVSFSETKGIDLVFLPVEEARGFKEVPKHVRVRIRSQKDFDDRKPEQVLLDRTGRIRWRSRRMN